MHTIQYRPLAHKDTQGRGLRRHCPEGVDYGSPDFFTENPHNGLVKTLELVAEMPQQICDDVLPVRKDAPKADGDLDEGRLGPRRPLCKHDCPFQRGRTTHRFGPHKGDGSDTHFSLDELYAITAVTCSEVAAYRAWARCK